MRRNVWALLAVAVLSGNALAAPSALEQLRSWAPAGTTLVPVSAIPAYEVVAVVDAGQKANAHRAEVLKERNTIFMLAAMSTAFINFKSSPPVGYDIDAVLAWDVEDIGKTPKFLIERNRNLENRGDIYHAERTAMDRAYQLGKAENYNLPLSASRDEIYKSYSHYLANSTIYTTLEPCPMCATTMLLARVPKAIYCMEDPGLRDPQTHQPSADKPVLKAVYGRKLSQEMSTVDQCVNTNKTMWTDIDRWKTNSAPDAAPDHPEWGKSFFSIIDYLHDRTPAIYGSAYNQLSNYTVQYPENQQLFEKLKNAVGQPAADGGKGAVDDIKDKSGKN